jgi:hypothetical protein
VVVDPCWWSQIRDAVAHDDLPAGGVQASPAADRLASVTSTTKEAQRAELHKTIWRIANDWIPWALYSA